MSEIHALTGAYAVDALDDIERAQFERHLADCSSCSAEVLELRETAAVLTEDSMAQPPAALRDRVLAEIATVRPLPPRVAETSVNTETAASSRAVEHRAPRRTRWTSLAVAAAAVVTLGVGGTVVWNQVNDESTQRTISATDQVLQAPDAESATVKVGDGAEATLVRSEELGKAVLITDNMPATPDGKAYQMWLLTDGGTLASAGMMEASADQTVLLSGDAAHATAAAISVEPVGGSTQPTTEPVALIDFSTLETT